MFKSKLLIVWIGLFGVGCATTEYRSASESTYYDAAFNDRNRAPASMQPPSSVDHIDEVHFKTQADFHFSVAEALSYEGKHQRAIEELKKVLIYDPSSYIVPMKIAGEYIKLGMLSEAIEHAEASVERNTKFADSRVLLGGLYSTLRLFEKARIEYEVARKIEPDHTEVPIYLGAVYSELKLYDKAVVSFESLLKNDEFKQQHLAHYYSGRVRFEQGGKKFLKAAKEAFERSLKIKPDHIDSALSLAATFVRLGNQDLAKKTLQTFQTEQGPSTRVAEQLVEFFIEEAQYELAYEQLTLLEKSNPEDALNVKVRMALISIEQKKFDQAITKLKEVLSLVPESDKIRFYLAAVYEELGKGDQAVEEYLKIPAMSQFYPDSVAHATYLLKQKKDLQSALKVAESAYESRKDYPQFVAIYSSLLDETGQSSLAVKILSTAVEKHPENVQLRFFLGAIEDRIGNRKDSLASMRRVVELDPNHVQGLNYLAFTLAEMGEELEAAEIFVKRALSIEPHDGFILDTLGWVKFKQGEYAEAIKILEKAFHIQPKESIIAEHLGDVYFKQQLVEQAKVMYKKAYDLEENEQKLKEIKNKISVIENQIFNRVPASSP
jgi:tetratricopeptide (TPR) repeat protein